MRNILDRIRYLGREKDYEVEGAAERLKGAIVRLKRQNPFMLQLPKPVRRVDHESEE